MIVTWSVRLLWRGGGRGVLIERKDEQIGGCADGGAAY